MSSRRKDIKKLLLVCALSAAAVVSENIGTAKIAQAETYDPETPSRGIGIPSEPTMFGAYTPFLTRARFTPDEKIARFRLQYSNDNQCHDYDGCSELDGIAKKSIRGETIDMLDVIDSLAALQFTGRERTITERHPWTTHSHAVSIDVLLPESTTIAFSLFSTYEASVSLFLPREGAYDIADVPINERGDFSYEEENYLQEVLSIIRLLSMYEPEDTVLRMHITKDDGVAFEVAQRLEFNEDILYSVGLNIEIFKRTYWFQQTSVPDISSLENINDYQIQPVQQRQGTLMAGSLKTALILPHAYGRPAFHLNIERLLATEDKRGEDTLSQAPKTIDVGVIINPLETPKARLDKLNIELEFRASLNQRENHEKFNFLFAWHYQPLDRCLLYGYFSVSDRQRSASLGIALTTPPSEIARFQPYIKVERHERILPSQNTGTYAWREEDRVEAGLAVSVDITNNKIK